MTFQVYDLYKMFELLLVNYQHCLWYGMINFIVNYFTKVEKTFVTLKHERKKCIQVFPDIINSVMFLNANTGDNM